MPGMCARPAILWTSPPPKQILRWTPLNTPVCRTPVPSYRTLAYSFSMPERLRADVKMRKFHSAIVGRTLPDATYFPHPPRAYRAQTLTRFLYSGTAAPTFHFIYRSTGAYGAGAHGSGWFISRIHTPGALNITACTTGDVGLGNTAAPAPVLSPA